LWYKKYSNLERRTENSSIIFPEEVWWGLKPKDILAFSQKFNELKDE